MRGGERGGEMGEMVETRKGKKEKERKAKGHQNERECVYVFRRVGGKTELELEMGNRMCSPPPPRP